MSRKKLITEITDSAYSLDYIESEAHILANFILMMTFSPMELLIWFSKRKLIERRRKCGSCNVWMGLTVESQKKSKHLWRCSLCTKRLSVWKDSFFESYKLNPEKILAAMYMWAKGDKLKNIKRELNISKQTMSNLAADFREIAAVYLMEEDCEMIGGVDENGNGLVVEIDESYFFRRKYNRGRLRDGQWVFGGIQRNSNKCFMVVVPDRTAETLMRIIQNKIAPGSLIISDGWSSYSSLYNSDIYGHAEIVHAENFVDPADRSIHTQNIECLWSHAKRNLREKFGCRSEELQNYLAEFIFKKKFKDENIINQIFLTLVKYY